MFVCEITFRTSIFYSIENENVQLASTKFKSSIVTPLFQSVSLFLSLDTSERQTNYITKLISFFYIIILFSTRISYSNISSEIWNTVVIIPSIRNVCIQDCLYTPRLLVILCQNINNNILCWSYIN